MRVLSVWAAILVSSFVFTHSLEAKVFKWVDANGTIHYSDKPAKKLKKSKKLKKLKNTKARISPPRTASLKTGQQKKNDRENFGKAKGRLINLKGRINTCQNLSEKIEFCEPYTCQMSHPINEIFVISHSISGIKDDKCHYERTMPNNGLMTCNFSAWQRKQYARLKQDMYSGKTIKNGTSLKMEASLKMDSIGKNDLQFKIMKEKASYKLNRKETEKLFSEAIENGNCVIRRN